MAHTPNADDPEYDIIFKQNAVDGIIKLPGLRRGEPAVTIDSPGNVSLYVGTDGTSANNVKIGPVSQDKSFVALKEVYRTQLMVSPYAQSYVDVFEEDIAAERTGLLDTGFGEFFGGYYTTSQIPVINPISFVVYVSASSNSNIALSVSYSGSPTFIPFSEGDNVQVNGNATSIRIKLDVLSGRMFGFNWMRL
jgi:hypothetical protein